MVKILQPGHNSADLREPLHLGAGRLVPGGVESAVQSVRLSAGGDGANSPSCD